MYIYLIVQLVAAAACSVAAILCWETKEYVAMALFITGTLAMLMFAQVTFTAILHRRVMGYGR